uniref:Uncharacterized protein n=1 Tax=Odontella aurita TaxID=265563 RepID=A0A7S4MWM1_9STRA|mmetsp:Transcript_35641/g.106356  ORF Transcript_35641/g.106356 Transcript_35641/m.106356 type:complete len:180 (+) Transcript_35641:140-679(+)
MADDLDAFFDEVSAAEEEAKRDSKEDDKRDINGGKNGEEALTAEESPKNDQGDERPVKRPKVHLASAGGAVVISKAAVVVAAKPAIVAAAQPTVVVSKPSTTTDVGESAVTTIKPIAPAPPPLPPGPPPPKKAAYTFKKVKQSVTGETSTNDDENKGLMGKVLGACVDAPCCGNVCNKN